jgi:spore maturation protein CgeB
MLILSSTTIKEALSYNKFKDDQLSALVINSGYFVQQDVINTLPKLGCKVQVLDIKISDSVNDTLKALIDALLLYKPDFLLSINYLGFDDTYRIGDFLNFVEFPTVVYCVDNPLFILQKPKIPAEKVTTSFVWDKTLLSLMRTMGAEDVHYLPLGSDPDKFRLCSGIKIDKKLSFVGNSMATAQFNMRSRLSVAGCEKADELSELFNQGRRLDELLKTVKPEGIEPTDKRQDVWRLAVWTATIKKRFNILKFIKHDDLIVYGDAGWTRVIPDINLAGTVPYGEPLSKIYASSHISINSTSYQMPTAINQRVLDVPLSGGFVLTDDQEEMYTFFDVGTEAIVYKNPEDFIDKSKYYLSHSDERTKVITAGRERVLRDHTYEIRLKGMLDILKKRWGKMSLM